MENQLLCGFCKKLIPEDIISCQNPMCIDIAIDEYNKIPKDDYWHDLYLK